MLLIFFALVALAVTPYDGRAEPMCSGFKCVSDGTSLLQVQKNLTSGTQRLRKEEVLGSETLGSPEIEAAPLAALQDEKSLEVDMTGETSKGIQYVLIPPYNKAGAPNSNWAACHLMQSNSPKVIVGTTNLVMQGKLKDIEHILAYGAMSRYFVPDKDSMMQTIDFMLLPGGGAPKIPMDTAHAFAKAYNKAWQNPALNVLSSSLLPGVGTMKFYIDHMRGALKAKTWQLKVGAGTVTPVHGVGAVLYSCKPKSKKMMFGTMLSIMMGTVAPDLIPCTVSTLGNILSTKLLPKEVSKVPLKKFKQ